MARESSPTPQELTACNNGMTVAGMPQKKSPKVEGRLSKGAVMAAKYRARANTLSNEERRRLRARAMGVINPVLP